MKRSLLLLSTVLLAGTAQAQLGLRAGLNTTILAKEPSRGLNGGGGLGYQAGVFYQHPLTTTWSVVPELQLNRQNLSITSADNSLADDTHYGRYKLQLTYLSLPVLGRATFGNVFVEAGPQVGYLLAAHRTGVVERGTLSGRLVDTIDDSSTTSYRRLDAGVAVGAGVQLPAGLALGVRLYSSVRSFNTKDDYQPFQYSGRLKSQVLQASLTYQLKARS